MDSSNPIRAWRNSQNLSLDEACDMFVAKGFDRPSTAKLSRIERDQDVPVEMIAAVEAVTGLPPKALRPDLAEMFGGIV